MTKFKAFAGRSLAVLTGSSLLMPLAKALLFAPLFTAAASALLTSPAEAQCCCGGVVFNLRDETGKLIAVPVSYQIWRGGSQTQQTVNLKPDNTKVDRYNLYAGCFSFDLAEATIVHQGKTMRLRWRNAPSGEPNIVMQTLTFQPGIYEFDFQQKFISHCLINLNLRRDNRCVIPASQWKKVNDATT